MKFKIGKIIFSPLELIKKPFHLIILVLLILFFSNALTMWGQILGGRSPYGSQEDFQTLNGKFRYTLVLSKFTTAEEELLELNNHFDQFKQENPQYKNSALYRTNQYYNISPWMFWKWYRYFETSHILKYPFLNKNKIIKLSDLEIRNNIPHRLNVSPACKKGIKLKSET